MAVFPINTTTASPVHPDYSGKLIPQIWSRKLLERFYDATCLSMITNTDYEGEISNMGDTVIVNKIPDITIRDYAMGDTLQIERPAADTDTMLIDQGKYWQFIMDDVAGAQALLDMTPKWAENASERLKIVVDTNVLSYMVGKAAATNRGATAGKISSNINLGTAAAPVQLTKLNIIDYIVDIGQAMDETNVPESNRKIVIPAWMAALIKKSDLKDASVTGDSVSVMRNGRLGVVDRFELFSSNLLPKSGANHYIFAMDPKATSFATQLTKTETLRAQTTFGDLFRGLMVFGRKTFYPELLVEGVVVKGA